MKAKFRYVDLLVAGAVGSLIALAVHHQLRKAKAQKYIDQMGVNKPPVPDADIDEDDFGDAEAYDYEHFADVLKHMEPQERDDNTPAEAKADVSSGTNTADESLKDIKVDSGPAAYEHTSAVEAEKMTPMTGEKDQTATDADTAMGTESEGESA